jgi:hypothetical protein
LMMAVVWYGETMNVGSSMEQSNPRKNREVQGHTIHMRDNDQMHRALTFRLEDVFSIMILYPFHYILLIEMLRHILPSVSLSSHEKAKMKPSKKTPSITITILILIIIACNSYL